MALDLDRLKAAQDAGRSWALGLKKGQRYLGASPAATGQGYVSNTPEHRLFIDSALDVLMAARIITDTEGIMVEDPFLFSQRGAK